MKRLLELLIEARNQTDKLEGGQKLNTREIAAVLDSLIDNVGDALEEDHD